ncbi:winged helix-turn-helix domain-containing protein [Streptomyces sp. NPDC003090]|uniref:winged helix-turn-helix domain-containing protein n=1 Tax=Streptomyces sp. NPDC003090 TaxID=3154274 RepID=UPI0037F1A5F9
MTGGMLRLDPVERLAVQVTLHPGGTVFSVLKDLFRAPPERVPARWRRALRMAVPTRALDAVRPVLAQRDCFMPDGLALIPDLTAFDLAEVGARLRALDPHRTAAEVSAYFEGAPPPAWRGLMDDPRGFLAAYALVVDAVTDAVAPRWRKAGPLLSRETERVGAAVVTGAVDALLGTLPAPVRYEEGRMRLTHSCGVESMAGRPLVLMPLVAGFTSGMYGVDRDDAVWFAYPVPGLGHLESGQPGEAAPAEADPLGLVLGPVRSQILRRLLLRPTLGRLSRELSLSPSTLTYHCDQLAAAGLLHRERRGRHVVVTATPRGTALTRLLTDIPDR